MASSSKEESQNTKGLPEVIVEPAKTEESEKLEVLIVPLKPKLLDKEEVKNNDTSSEKDSDSGKQLLSKSEQLEKKKNDIDAAMSRVFLFHPNGKYKQIWDMFATVALIATCFITPYQLAFYSHFQTEPRSLTVIN